jgi:hypothetical protein
MPASNTVCIADPVPNVRKADAFGVTMHNRHIISAWQVSEKA